MFLWRCGSSVSVEMICGSRDWLLGAVMGSRSFSEQMKRRCPHCVALRGESPRLLGMDSYGLDDPEIGSWCGCCDAQWEGDVCRAKLSLCSSRQLPPLPPVAIAKVVECLAGNIAARVAACKRSTRVTLLRLVLHGKPHGVHTVMGPFIERGAHLDTQRDVLDYILEFVVPYTQSMYPSMYP